MEPRRISERAGKVESHLVHPTVVIATHAREMSRTANQTAPPGHARASQMRRATGRLVRLLVIASLATLALPVVIARDHALIFRAWHPDEALVRGSYGIFQPSSDAPEIDPDIVLVPLAAFDRAGHRIGYGRGYYDRTLQNLRAVKKITVIGIAFAVQEIDIVPRLPHDEQLDCVLTERELIDLRSH